MNIIDKLNRMIEEAEEMENYKFANALSSMQLEIIQERSKEWDKGYAIGYDLGIKEAKFKEQTSKSLMNV
jgi:hypothetical protein